jgi:hypothetical protein
MTNKGTTNRATELIAARETKRLAMARLKETALAALERRGYQGSAAAPADRTEGGDLSS